MDAGFAEVTMLRGGERPIKVAGTSMAVTMDV